MKTKFLVLFFFWKNKEMDKRFDNKTTHSHFSFFSETVGFSVGSWYFIYGLYWKELYLIPRKPSPPPLPKGHVLPLNFVKIWNKFLASPISYLTLKIWYHFGTDFAYNNTSHILSQFVNKDCTGYIMLQFESLTSKIKLGNDYITYILLY